MQDSVHFLDMLNERRISPEWVDLAVNNPDRIEVYGDGTQHFIKKILEFGGRWLRVVVNVTIDPQKRVTAFFDRRLSKIL